MRLWHSVRESTKGTENELLDAFFIIIPITSLVDKNVYLHIQLIGAKGGDSSGKSGTVETLD